MIAMLLYIRIRSTGPGCPTYNESHLRCDEVLPQDRQAITAAHCKSLGCCKHDGSEMQWCNWATSTHTTTTDTNTTTQTTLVTTITNTTTQPLETVTNTTTQTLAVSTITNMSSYDEANVVKSTTAESSRLTSSEHSGRRIVPTLMGTTAASTTTTTTSNATSAQMVISGKQGISLTASTLGSGNSTTSGPEMLARSISPDSITFFGPCSVIFASVALISVWCYRSKVKSTSVNKYMGVPHGSGAVCIRPGCEKLTWNGQPGQYCSHRCRKAATGKRTKRGEGGSLPSPPHSTLTGSFAPLLSEATGGDSNAPADSGNRCLTTGCGKPTWNGQPGFCSAECYDEMEREQHGAKASAPPMETT